MIVTLDNILVKQMHSYSKSEFEHLLRTEQIALTEVYPRKDVQRSIDLAIEFCGYFLAAGEALHLQGKLDKKRDVEPINLIGSYFGSQMILGDEDILTLSKSEGKPDLGSIPFKRSDTSVLDIVLRKYFAYLHEAGSALEFKSPRYFQQLGQHTNHILQNRFEGLVKDIGISYNDRQISVQRQEENPVAQSSESISAPKVDRTDIIGNTEAIDKLERSVHNLLLYDPTSQSHPLLNGNSLGYQQGFLLLGDTGSGKTLTAKYAMSLGNELAKKYSKKFTVTRFNIYSSYQEGGVQMLKSQLEEISDGFRAHIIFVDEIDTLFASRNEQASHYQRMKLGEIMRFLDGDYENKGNYILLATGNDPDKIDRALKNARLERIYCPGPETREEKGDVLRIHLNGAQHTISDFGALGQLAQQYDLTGRQLRDVAKYAKELSSNWNENQWDRLLRSPHVEETKKLVSMYTAPIDDQTITKVIRQYGHKDFGEQQARGAFHVNQS